ncbi:hypothetical protein BT93_J0368 [Corymbia citriodora subsp. variegata]|nr:hypothetical protein BT93_J0368 [Corymbia citriodora subsp. variegata]
MDPRTAGRQYEELQPTTNWALEDRFDTFIIHLPGFKKDQLRVQISSAGNLRVLGERQLTGNKWSRFKVETPISSNYDSNNISAKFDNNNLQVKFPKIIVPAPAEPRGEAKPAVQPTKPPEAAKPAIQPTKPPGATPTAEPQKTGQKQETEEPPKTERAPVKLTEKEKKPKKSTEDEQKPKDAKEESKKADEPKYVPETALQQKKSEDWAEKDQKRGETADIGKKMEKAETSKARVIPRPRAEDSEEGSFVAKRRLRNLMNTVVAALLILVLGLYVKHALRSFGTPKSDPEL